MHMESHIAKIQPQLSINTFRRDICNHINSNHKTMNKNNNSHNNGQDEEMKTDHAMNEDAAEQSKIEDTEVIDSENPDVATTDTEPEESSAEQKIEKLESELAREKKEYMFLMAEFDNFRKRTVKEKAELIKNGGEKVLKGLLPIADDFERGIKASDGATDAEAVLEGLILIYNKLRQYLEQNGVKEMDSTGDVFDTEKHEAISVVPVPDEDQKGKILDTVLKGYTLNDKVLRHAKVVVGQ